MSKDYPTKEEISFRLHGQRAMGEEMNVPTPKDREDCEVLAEFVIAELDKINVILDNAVAKCEVDRLMECFKKL